jgi:Raf kinase inhibitor-like YbhB/YbcL family protein
MMRILIQALLAIVVVIALCVAFLLGRGIMRRNAVETLHQDKPAFTVTAAGIDNGALMPAELTCHGPGHAPAVTWSGAPPETKSYAILMMDFDVPSPDFSLGDFTHWSLFNIGQKVTHIDASSDAESLKAEHITLGQNSSGDVAYYPPCPPMGRHRYTLGVYALDVAELAPASSSPQDVMAAIKGHVLAYGEVAGKSE